MKVVYETGLSIDVKNLFSAPLNANFTKWSKTLKQFVGNLPTNCLSVFDHFVGLVLKGLEIDLRSLRAIDGKK